MGMSADATICWGVITTEDDEVVGEKYQGDDDWWLDVAGYVPIHEPFDEDGEWNEGWGDDDPRYDEYYEHRKAFLEANPPPFEVIRCGTEDGEIFVIAVPSTVVTCEGWTPRTFEDLGEPMPTEEEKAALLAFVEGQGIQIVEPVVKRILSAYYG